MATHLCPRSWPAGGEIARSWTQPPPAYLVGHRVLVRVPLLATLVFINSGHDLQDVVMGGESCGKDTEGWSRDENFLAGSSFCIISALKLEGRGAQFSHFHHQTTPLHFLPLDTRN